MRERDKKILFLGEERHTAVGKIGFEWGLVINMRSSPIKFNHQPSRKPKPVLLMPPAINSYKPRF